MLEGISHNLARNIKELREARGLTQNDLALTSGVPRATWANLESGSANPTLAVLSKAAAALHVSLEELLEPPRTVGTFFPASSLPVRKRGAATVRRLLPHRVPGLELERMELPPGTRMGGIPHTPGCWEYLTCESGRVELVVSGETWRLDPGDVVIFRGDQPHSYHNPSSVPAVAYSVLSFSPLSAGTP